MTVQNGEQLDQNTKDQKGKIIKGTLNDAPMKLRVSSIPARYQHVVYVNNKRPAFGNSKERFNGNGSYYYNQTDERVGPGVYRSKPGSVYQQRIFSKKGFGPMVSNTNLHRLQKQYTGLPGPGSYNLPAKLQESQQKMQRSQSVAYLSSSIQGHQLFKRQMQTARNIPGPGSYNTRLKKSLSLGHKFSNKIERFRDPTMARTDAPPVGTYNYQEFLQSSSRKSAVEYKKTNFRNEKNSKQKKLKSILSQSSKMEDIQKAVGPGSYNNSKLMQTKIGFRIHKTSIDRFGQSTSKISELKSSNLNQPSIQAHFRKVSSNGQTLIQTERCTHSRSEKKVDAPSLMQSTFMQSKGKTSMFKSVEPRYQFVNASVSDPCQYTPKKIDKKSHLVNFQRKWV